MTRLALLAALLMLPSQVSLARDDGGAASEELAKLNQDYAEASKLFREALSSAKSQEERSKLYTEGNPVREFLPKFRALARRAAQTDVAAEANLWIVENGSNAREEGEKAVNAAVETLIADHIQSELMERLAGRLRWAWSLRDRGEKALRAIIKDSPHAKARAAAMFSLATVLRDSNENGKKEAKSLLETVRKDHADTPYAEQAKSYLFELEHLQIGMTAPDFEATDHEGKTFKLSDYRGKVVVVDFWGFW